MVQRLTGIPISPGVAVGMVVLLTPARSVGPTSGAVEPSGERQRQFQVAVGQARAELGAIRDAAANQGQAETADILEAQLLFLDDPVLIDETERLMVEHALSPATALLMTHQALAEQFAELDDAYLRARAADLADIVGRLLRALSGGSALRLPEAPFVLVAEDLLPSQAAALDPAYCQAVALAGSGPTAHAAIIARALGLPAVVAVAGLLAAAPAGADIIVDGDDGSVVIGADEAEREQARQRRLAAAAEGRRRGAATAAPVTTRDGRRIEVAANIHGPAMARQAIEQGAEAIGLFRTEVLVVGRTTLPDETEQLAYYRAVLATAGERLVVFRTFDIGGDKPVPALGLSAEANPYLGRRGLRLSLSRPDLFEPQLRALLRAGTIGRPAIMFPMVSSVDELRQARAAVERATAALRAAGVAIGAPPPIGVMIETPAAALIADRLAPLVDFFSIGTNDLVQYSLAVDRNNPTVAALADAFHPAVLRLCQLVIEAAHAAGRWVGICGEVAAEMLALPLLVGLGFDELSMAPAVIPTIKAAIGQLSAADCQHLAETALAQATAADVRRLLAEWQSHGTGGDRPD